MTMIIKKIERDGDGRPIAVTERHLSGFEELVEITLPRIVDGLRTAAREGNPKPLVEIGPVAPGVDAVALGRALGDRLGRDPIMESFANGVDVRVLPAPPALVEEHVEVEDDELDDDEDDDEETD